jgi:hypothetical protein
LNHEAQAYLWVMPERALELQIDHYTEVAIKKYLSKNASN